MQKYVMLAEKRILKKLSKTINYQKVRDQCHYIGKYRSPANSICGLKSKLPNEILVVFHNGSNYKSFYYKRISNRVWGRENLNVLEKVQKGAKLFLFQ